MPSKESRLASVSNAPGLGRGVRLFAGFSTATSPIVRCRVNQKLKLNEVFDGERGWMEFVDDVGKQGEVSDEVVLGASGWS